MTHGVLAMVTTEGLGLAYPDLSGQSPRASLVLTPAGHHRGAARRHHPLPPLPSPTVLPYAPSPMTPTRVDTKKLRSAVTLAVKKLGEAVDALEPHLAVLPDAERATIPRVRSDFPSAARKLAVESEKHGDVVAATDYDAEAVLEDLDNVEALAALADPLARLQRMLDDSRLLWLAEAYVPSLELYGVAKVRAKKDGKLAQAIAPLAEMFATPRRKRTNTPEPGGQ